MSLQVKDIVCIENDQEILSFKSEEGFLIWPLIRIDFLNQIIFDQLRTELKPGKARKTSRLHKRRILYQSKLNNWIKLLRPHNDIVIMTSGTGLIKEGQAAFNRLTDHFASITPQKAITLEELNDYRWPFPRVNNKVLIEEPGKIKIQKGINKVLDKHHGEQASRLLSYVEEQARNKFGWTLGEERRNSLLTALSRSIAGIEVAANYYRELFERIRPKLLLLEEACYGHFSIVNKVARELGIKIAEFQHGIIHPNHPAYNYSDFLCTNQEYFEKALPDYFLLYGQWWGEQVNIPDPIKKVVIGNPHRTEIVSNLDRKDSGGNNIVVLGNGFNVDQYTELILNLQRELGDQFEYYYRPHPGEKARENQGKVSDSNIRIDNSPDIYQMFARAKVVIAEGSTAMFEAIGLVDRIIVWDRLTDRRLLEDHPFESFKTIDDLVELLRSAKMEYSASELWAESWRDKYKQFLKNEVGLED